MSIVVALSLIPLFYNVDKPLSIHVLWAECNRMQSFNYINFDVKIWQLAKGPMLVNKTTICQNNNYYSNFQYSCKAIVSIRKNFVLAFWHGNWYPHVARTWFKRSMHSSFILKIVLIFLCTVYSMSMRIFYYCIHCGYSSSYHEFVYQHLRTLSTPSTRRQKEWNIVYALRYKI